MLIKNQEYCVAGSYIQQEYCYKKIVGLTVFFICKRSEI